MPDQETYRAPLVAVPRPEPAADTIRFVEPRTGTRAVTLSEVRRTLDEQDSSALDKIVLGTLRERGWSKDRYSEVFEEVQTAARRLEEEQAWAAEGVDPKSQRAHVRATQIAAERSIDYVEAAGIAYSEVYER